MWDIIHHRSDATVSYWPKFTKNDSRISALQLGDPLELSHSSQIKYLADWNPRST